MPSLDFYMLVWLIPLLPFASFVFIALYARKDCELSHIVAIVSVCLSLVAAQIVFWIAVLEPVGGGAHAVERVAYWLSAGKGHLQASVWIDPLTTVMLFMVPITCLMIFIYSVGYMNFGTPEQDRRYARFFAYISLFAFGMLGMVVSGNLLMLFIFWEIMGTCSYLLIGFWYEKKSAMEAGLKAFLVTKVGDLFLMLGLVALYSATGTLQFREVFSPEMLHQLGEAEILGLPALPVIALLFFGGTVGKSAQVPLHVWLPDAMEGPTPVSALIHAATMVSAGVYLVARMWPLTLAAAGLAPGVVLWIGAITAAYGAIIGAFQDDIKRVFAFSTISQLGYMIAALGLGALATDPVLQIGAYFAGVFHLITHAFFKALLFLASGSVIHGMEHGHHHAHAHGHGEHHGGKPFDPNDMKNMGGLRTRMPRTFWTLLAGGLALSGVPIITAGFWSKDEILAMAWGIYRAPFWILAVSAGLTAFYTGRQIALTFLGKPRTSAAEHAPESVPSMTVPLIILAVFAVSLGWVGIPDNFLGVDWPQLVGVEHINWAHGFLERTIEEYVHAGGSGQGEHGAVGLLASRVLAEGAGHAYGWTPLLIGLAFALGGLALGLFLYGSWQPLTRADELDPLERGMRKVWLGWLYEFFRRRMMFDEVYHVLFVRPAIWIADAFDAFDYGQKGGHGFVDGAVQGLGWLGRQLSVVADWLDAHFVDALVDLAGRAGRLTSTGLDTFDLKIVDGAVDGVGTVVKAGGRAIRPFQSGKVQGYLLLASLAVVLLVAMFVMIVFLQI